MRRRRRARTPLEAAEEIHELADEIFDYVVKANCAHFVRQRDELRGWTTYEGMSIHLSMTDESFAHRTVHKGVPCYAYRLVMQFRTDRHGITLARLVGDVYLGTKELLGTEYMNEHSSFKYDRVETILDWWPKYRPHAMTEYMINR